jgi:hypothetical protein
MADPDTLRLLKYARAEQVVNGPDDCGARCLLMQLWCLAFERAGQRERFLMPCPMCILRT